MTEEMTEEQKSAICRASIHAQKIADAMNIAYWTTDNRSVFEFQTKDAHESFAKLAEVMGYNVELKE